MYFEHKHVETGPNCSHKLATFLKYHIPTLIGCFQRTNSNCTLLIHNLNFPAHECSLHNAYQIFCLRYFPKFSLFTEINPMSQIFMSFTMEIKFVPNFTIIFVISARKYVHVANFKKFSELHPHFFKFLKFSSRYLISYGNGVIETEMAIRQESFGDLWPQIKVTVFLRILTSPCCI